MITSVLAEGLEGVFAPVQSAETTVVAQAILDEVRPPHAPPVVEARLRASFFFIIIFLLCRKASMIAMQRKPVGVIHLITIYTHIHKGGGVPAVDQVDVQKTLPRFLLSNETPDCGLVPLCDLPRASCQTVVSLVTGAVRLAVQEETNRWGEGTETEGGTHAGRRLFSRRWRVLTTPEHKQK